METHGTRGIKADSSRKPVQSLFSFGPDFLQDHAGQLVTEPRIAVVELIANSYDAGATKVEITWPEKITGLLAVEDNGTGMTRDEFDRRWRTLCYNRIQEQGPDAEFPPEAKHGKRAAFGRSGKGRHGAFCFADSYRVDTWKDGKFISVLVAMTHGGTEPFRCVIERGAERKGHGTRIFAQAERQLIAVDTVKEWIGTKFVVDPSFAISVNGEALKLLSLRDLKTEELPVEPYGLVKVHHIDATAQDRSTMLRGITWWVNGRMVGQPSWSGLDETGAILDGRYAPAKRYSFVVEADLLKPDVKSDWSGFNLGARFTAVRDAVRVHITRAIDTLLAGTRKERKKAAIDENRKALGELSGISKRVVGTFIDEVQQKCPTIAQGDLSRTVEVLVTMEKARSGYELLSQLAACSPDDIDTWNSLMQQWTATNAQIVLGELGKRLELVGRLQELVGAKKADELHEIQPLFDRGLWIFGPEYEAVDFSSNRSMATLIGQLLGGSEETLSRRRPDFVAVADSSVGVYGADSYDENGEVSGVRKVLIVELKKGGFTVTAKEVHQAQQYATELRKAKLVQPDTDIVAYILGNSLSDDALETEVASGRIRLQPMPYETVLRKAHTRTFNLQKKLQSEQPITSDPEIDEVLSHPIQKDLFQD